MISLVTRVALAYARSGVPVFGVCGIWWAIPVGWFLADVTGILYGRADLFCRLDAGDVGIDD